MHHCHVHHQHEKVLAHNVDMRQSRTRVNCSQNQLERIEIFMELRDPRLSSGPKRKETSHKKSEHKTVSSLKTQYPSNTPWHHFKACKTLRNTNTPRVLHMHHGELRLMVVLHAKVHLGLPARRGP